MDAGLGDGALHPALVSMLGMEPDWDFLFPSASPQLPFPHHWLSQNKMQKQTSNNTIQLGTLGLSVVSSPATATSSSQAQLIQNAEETCCLGPRILSEAQEMLSFFLVR